MPLRLPLLLLLGALLVTAQLSCLRPRTTETAPTPKASPTEQDVINDILKHYEEALGGDKTISSITSLRIKVDELEHNIPIDDAVFRKP